MTLRLPPLPVRVQTKRNANEIPPKPGRASSGGSRGSGDQLHRLKAARFVRSITEWSPGGLAAAAEGNTGLVGSQRKGFSLVIDQGKRALNHERTIRAAADRYLTHRISPSGCDVQIISSPPERGGRSKCIRNHLIVRGTRGTNVQNVLLRCSIMTIGKDIPSISSDGAGRWRLSNESHLIRGAADSRIHRATGVARRSIKGKNSPLWVHPLRGLVRWLWPRVRRGPPARGAFPAWFARRFASSPRERFAAGTAR